MTKASGNWRIRSPRSRFGEGLGDDVAGPRPNDMAADDGDKLERPHQR